jgi:hypothetical protein
MRLSVQPKIWVPVLLATMLSAANAVAVNVDVEIEALGLTGPAPYDYGEFLPGVDNRVGGVNQSGSGMLAYTGSYFLREYPGEPAFYEGVGYTGWVYNGDTIEFTTDGRNDALLNDAGQVAGSSHGTAYLKTGSTTETFGLFDAEHVDITPYPPGAGGTGFSNIAHRMNNTGQVVGNATRYTAAGDPTLGRTIWFYDGVTTRNIGLVDTNHTNADGFRLSVSGHINDAGQVVGSSNRYRVGTNITRGNDVWLFDGADTQIIGLTDSAHTASGLRKGSADSLNEVGQVLGSSVYYGAAKVDTGRSAWFYDGNTTQVISFTDQDHVRDNDGYRYSEGLALNQAGQAIGHSERYGATASLGKTAWLYDGGLTKNIGLIDTEHTSGTAYRVSEVVGLNEAGVAAGYAERYEADGSDLGHSAWLYDGASTQIIGLLDTEHTRASDGYRSSQSIFVNESGQVAGTALRFSVDGSDLGQSVWLYDGTETIGLDALSSSSTGYEYSQLLHLGDDGTVIGLFEKYDETGVLLGDYLFGYTAETGLFDYGFEVESEWRVRGINDLNEIFVEQGYIYKITATAVPLPAGVWLFVSALGLLGLRHKRQLQYTDAK